MTTLAPAHTSFAPTAAPAAPALRVLLRLGRVRGVLLVEVAERRAHAAAPDEGRRRDHAAHAAAVADLERHRTAALVARRTAAGA